MCNSTSFKIVSKCKEGYISECAGCQRMSLVFENIYLHMTLPDLQSFSRQLTTKTNVWKMDTYVGNKKKIVFQTPFENTFFCFTEKEYFSLERLTSSAVTNLYRQNYL
ncbi:MAG: hypothetical protein QMB24_12225, partial [Spirosomataceae bacterium]